MKRLQIGTGVFTQDFMIVAYAVVLLLAHLASSN